MHQFLTIYTYIYIYYMCVLHPSVAGHFQETTTGCRRQLFAGPGLPACELDDAKASCTLDGTKATLAIFVCPGS